MKIKVFIIIIAAIFLIGIVGSAIVLTAPKKSTARIISDGQIVETIDLDAAEDRTFDVSYGGHVNTVEIKDHRIRIKDADCPDKTCVNMGWLKSSSAPIVCLPHRLVIEFADGTDDIDAVTR